MKALYNMTNHSKENKFNLFLYDILSEIDNKANTWFEEVFISPKDYIPTEILDSNLIDDLDYLLTEAIWLLELGESLGYGMKDTKMFLESQYNNYVENGFKALVSDCRYSRIENRVLTEKEIKDSQDKMNATMKKLLSEMDF